MGAETVDRAATGSGKAAHMAGAPDNPDRNFSSNGDPEKTDQDKRPADRNQVGEVFDAEARRRFGEVIAASLNPKKPRRRK